MPRSQKSVIIRVIFRATIKLIDKKEHERPGFTAAVEKRKGELLKNEAKKHHTHYQKMIRRLLDLYASRHQGLRLKGH